MGRVRAVVLLLLPVAAAFGCQALSDLIPTLPSKDKASPSPSPTATASLPALTIPVVKPKPTPTPTPAPTPTPEPTPAPTPDPGSVNGPGACSLPPSNPANPTCVNDPPQFSAQVETAITRTTQAHPEYFDFNDKKCDNCYLVTNIDGYIREMKAQLAAQGICTYWDGEEMAVKDTNAFSEQYDILLASNHIRRAPGAYRGDCKPAWF